MTGPGSKSALLALLLAAGLAAACASSASITEIQTNPSHYQNRTVTLTGVVTTIRLNRAMSISVTRRQSTPSDSHQFRNFAIGRR